MLGAAGIRPHAGWCNHPLLDLDLGIFQSSPQVPSQIGVSESL